MSEAFLHFIWQQKLFETEHFETISGEKIEVISTGEYNTNAGADFQNARIKIGDTLWAGNVEIHLNTSDWFKHKHSENKAYQNTILHLVAQQDRDLSSTEKLPCPTAILPFRQELFLNYKKLLDSVLWIPCQEEIGKTDKFSLKMMFSRLAIERLEQKSTQIIQTLEQNKKNYEETFYWLLAKTFGFHVNSLPFELLAKQTPLSVIGKHKNNLLQLEALFFGQAGMLENELDDAYYQSLQKEFHFLKTKFNLKSIDNSLWKYLRLRPVNFPSIRIAQFVSLLHQSSSLFSKIIETQNLTDIEQYFSVSPSEYWLTHYRFGQTSARKNKNLGANAFESIAINCIIPILFVYGKLKNDDGLKTRALDFLEQLPPEDNSITRKFCELGIENKNAFTSQALLMLKNDYCASSNCLNCQIGNKLIRKK